MTGLIIFSAVLVAALSQFSLATAGGNESMQRYFCKPQGCAANVSVVYCNNKIVWDDKDMEKCSGLSPANTVCQRDGRAFVSTDTDGRCEFEGNGYPIETEKCEANNTICALDQAPLSTPNSNAAYVRKRYGLYGSGLLLLLLLVLLTLSFKNKKRRPSQQGIQLNNKTGCGTRERSLLDPESANGTSHHHSGPQVEA